VVFYAIETTLFKPWPTPLDKEKWFI